MKTTIHSHSKALLSFSVTLPSRITKFISVQHKQTSKLNSNADKMVDMMNGIDPVLVGISAISWFLILYFGKLALHRFMNKIAGDIPLETVRIPTTFPVVDPPGASVEFEKRVVDATKEEIADFLEYRGLDRDAGLGVAADEAITLRRELWDIKLFTHYYQIYTLSNRKWPYAKQMLSWSGWKGWYREMGPNSQKWVLGNAMYAFQHALTGLIAAIHLYVAPSSEIVRFALYSDIGFNIVDLVLMIVSVAMGIDVTILCGVRMKPSAEGTTDMRAMNGTYKGLIVHHFGAFMLEAVSLSMDTSKSADFVAESLVALLGTTGALHFYASLMAYTPVRQNRMWDFLNNLIILSVFMWYRAIYWVIIVLRGSYLSFLNGGAVTGLTTAFFYAFFTIFNYHGVMGYVKSTKRAWTAWTKSEQGQLFFSGKPRLPSTGTMQLLAGVTTLSVFELLRTNLVG